MAVQITGWFPRLNATVAAPAMHATATLNPPTLSEVASVAISAPAMTATAVLERPVVSLNVAVAAPRMAASASMSAPTVLAGIVVAAPAMHATGVLNSPTVAASRFLSVSVPAMTATAAMATPAVTQAVGVAITATPMAATAVLKTPTVVATTNVAVSAPAMTATAAAHVPTVSASVSITAPAMTATAAAKTPAVSVNAAISAPAMTATAAAKTPTVVASTNVSVSAPKMTATATANVPTVAVSIPGPAFDAIGPGAIVNNLATATWSHTAATGADIFVFSVSGASNPAFNPSGITYNGAAMTLLEGTDLSFTFGQLWHIAAAGTGSPANIVMTSTDANFFVLNSISFTRVTSVSAVATANGSSFPSQSVTLTGATILQSFLFGSATTAQTATGGTAQYSGFNSAGNAALTINTATATTTFADAVAAVGGWMGIAVQLS